MQTLNFNEMELIEGGWKDPSCERVAGWLVGFGASLCFSGALLPLGIVVASSGLASAGFCSTK